ncbi:hypothetical protein Trydic_g19184 [Trypoxylus dichotomus]
MNLVWYVIYMLYLENVFGKVTKRENKLLSRKRRYLFFPKGANFVYQIVDVKALMKIVPKGVQWLNEWDVPYPLPSDPSEFRKFRRHREKRQLLDDLEIALNRYGLNGTACVNRMVCEAKEFIPVKGKSLIKDMLYAVFSRPEEEDDDNAKLTDEDSCHASNFEECTAPLLHIMLGSFNNY